MRAHDLVKTRGAIPVRFDPHDDIRDVDQPAGHGPDAGADLQHARPNETPNQPEDMVAVAAGLEHRLQVVRGVAVLRLAESAVGGRGVLHRSEHGTTTERGTRNPEPEPGTWNLELGTAVAFAL